MHLPIGRDHTMSPRQKLALTQSVYDTRSLATYPVSGYRFVGIGYYSFLALAGYSATLLSFTVRRDHYITQSGIFMVHIFKYY